MGTFYQRSLLILSLILLVGSLLLTILIGNIAAQNEASITEVQYGIKLTLPMPYVPADARSYPLVLQIVNKEGQPRFLTKDVVIKLSSSNISIGYTEPTVLLKAGESSTVVAFRTTCNTGCTNITASASGLFSDTATVRTVGISGKPARLVAYVLPSKVLAKAGAKAIIIVELQDGNGLPARASEDLVVALFSSITSVGKTDATLDIRRNSTFGTAYFYPTNQPGVTEIKAATSGLESAKVAVITVAYNPNKLAVYVLPPILPKQSRGAILVQIQDTYGQPLVATNDVKVVLTSNDTSISVLDTNFLTIPKGMSYGRADVITGNITGAATIYASAQGYESSSYTLLVRDVQESGEGRLLLSSLPKLISDGKSHTVLSIIMMNDNLTNPVRPPYPTKIYLSSSNTRIGMVNEVILNENGYVYANFTSYTAGNTTITAAADNYDASQSMVSVVEPRKFRLNLHVCPSLVPIDSPYKPVVLVEIQDADGEPTVAPADTEIHLYSSNTRVGNVEKTLLVKQGENDGISYLELSSDLGNTTITAAANNFATASAAASTFKAGPSTITLNIEPSLLIADGSTTQNIFITLQDMFGYPAEAPSDIKITLSTSNTVIGTLPPSLTIPKHTTWIATYFTKNNAPGSTQVTAHAEGLQPSASTLSTVLLDLDVNLIVSSIRVYTYDQLTVCSIIQFERYPLNGAEVKWSTTGDLLEVQSRSDVEGLAKAIFTSHVEGEYVIKAAVSKPGFKSVESSIKVSVKPRSLYVEAKAPKEMRTFEESEITVKVMEDGSPLEGALVNYTCSRGNLAIVNNITDGQGVSKAKLRLSEPLRTSVHYVVKKTGYVVYNGSLVIDVKPQPLTIKLSTNASRTDANNAVEVTVSVVSGDRPVEGAILNWNVIGGTIVAKSDSTDAQGLGLLILKAEDAGTVTIDVSAVKRGYSSVITATSVDILPPPFYRSVTTPSFWQKNPLAIAIVAALAITCVFSITALRRRATSRNQEELEFVS